MASRKVTVDFSNYEEPTWEEYTGEDPPPNKWFDAKATRARVDEEQDQLVVIFEIIDGDYKGWGRGWYAPLDPSHEHYWKTHVLFKALQGGATKNVTVDVGNEKSLAAFIAKARPVKIKTREYNDKISLNRLAPMLEAVPDTGAKKASTSPKLDEPVADDEPVEDYSEEELSEMEVADLEEILTEEFEVPEADLPKKSARDRTGAKYKQALIEAILEEQDGDGDDGDEGDDEGEDFEDGFDGDADDEPEPEPEPEPAPRTRRSRAATAKAAPAKAAPAKATTTRRRRA